MILKEKVPGLADTLDGYARALTSGDAAAAERFVAERARDAHRAMFAELKRKNVLGTCEELALAKIGMQFMSKLRIERGSESAVLLNRWAQDERGGWKIVGCEDISAMRSPWSKIPNLKDAQVER